MKLWVQRLATVSPSRASAEPRVPRAFAERHYPLFQHSTIPPFQHSSIPAFQHSSIPAFHHSIIPPFHHSTIPRFQHSSIPLPPHPRHSQTQRSRPHDTVVVCREHHEEKKDAKRFPSQLPQGSLKPSWSSCASWCRKFRHLLRVRCASVRNSKTTTKHSKKCGSQDNARHAPHACRSDPEQRFPIVFHFL